MAKTKEELVAQAKELEIEVKDDATEEEIQTVIDEKIEADKKNLTTEELLKKVDYLTAENKKAYDKRDKSTTERKKLEKDLEEVQKQLKDSPDKEAFKELTEKLEEFEAESIERKDKEEEEADKKRTEVEKITNSFEKQMDKFKTELNKKVEKAVGQTEKLKVELKSRDLKIEKQNTKILEGDISKIAAENNAISPKQVVAILSSNFTWNDNINEFEYIGKDSNGKEEVFSVSEYVTQYLEDDENANLVKADATEEGIESKNISKTKKTTTKDTKITDRYSLKNPKNIKEAEVRGVTPEFYVKILKKEDDLAGKNKEE